MYVPPYYPEERPEVLAAAVREIQFTMLVTCGLAGFQISHLPTVLKEGVDGTWTLEAHIARANPHWKFAGMEAPSVAVFQGPQAYISPSWYASKTEHGKVVPTWNYIAIHAHGQLDVIDDEEWLLAHLNELTDANEKGRDHPWMVGDAPSDYIETMTKAIVGLRLRVTRIEASWKMNQMKPESDRLSNIIGLEAEPRGQTVADVMRALESSRGEASG